MAVVVFLRGVNVGGHRTFRPSILAQDLRAHDVVNVGAAGTLVVRKPGPRAAFRTKLRRKLPFAAEIMLCDGRDLVRLQTENPFRNAPPRADRVRFLSILAKQAPHLASVPCVFPPRGPWFVRVIAVHGQFVFGEYRRHMKTIGYLGQMDKLLGAPATTRTWNTIATVVRVLKGERGKLRRG